jgi:endonuclease/exonuclease/phosphatase family metal-dependent hydrolase
VVRDWRFEIGRAMATARIGLDYLTSLLLPVPSSREGAPSGLRAASHSTEPAVDPHPLSSPIRLLCWNIHRGYDRAGLRGGLRAIMRELDPHVILLQEVPVAASGPWWSEPWVRELLAGLGLVFAPMHRVRRPTAYYPFQESGVLLAARGGFDAPRAVLLPVVCRPKLGPDHLVERVAVGVRCVVDATPVGIWNVHLENTTRPSGRARQARAVAAAVGGGPAILAGDFNTVLRPLERVEHVLADAGFARTRLAGPARLLPQLDHFFVRGLWARRAERLPIRGSDHRPIFGEFEVAR